MLGQATGDSSFQEEREQNFESCQSSSDHFKAGLIGLTSGIFGGMTSILTQPYKGVVEEGVGVRTSHYAHSVVNLSLHSRPSLLQGFILGLGKGVVGTIAKPVAGVMDFASGTTAAIREQTSRVSRALPRITRLRRCCVGPTGALSCYSLELARGQEYLLRLNDGNPTEK